MKILVTGNSMSYLSGQPLYCYELCRELKKQGHDVAMLSNWQYPQDAEGYLLKENLLKAGVKIYSFSDNYIDNYDLIIASELVSLPVTQAMPNIPVLNVVHSEYDCETPLPNTDQVIKYICIRESIVEHIVQEHNIPPQKCQVIFNGVDRERFKPRKKPKRDYYKIVVPCTLDKLREKFLNHLIDHASPDKRVFIFGTQFDAQLHQSPYVYIHPAKFHIEEEIATADEVTGILFGRVNIEAWSCNVKTSSYHPDTLEYKVLPKPKNFDQLFNIKNVAKEMINAFLSSKH